MKDVKLLWTEKQVAFLKKAAEEGRILLLDADFDQNCDECLLREDLGGCVVTGYPTKATRCRQGLYRWLVRQMSREGLLLEKDLGF